MSAKEHRVAIVVNVNSESEDALLSDRKNLRHVFLNLIVNAIKYSKPDTEVSISYAKDKNYYIFKVTDHGEGMPAEDTAHIFEGYFRTGWAKKSNEVGTGLGLYLTKQIVEKKMGGTITVNSEIGNGSVFTVTVPKRYR